MDQGSAGQGHTRHPRTSKRVPHRCGYAGSVSRGDRGGTPRGRVGRAGARLRRCRGRTPPLREVAGHRPHGCGVRVHGAHRCQPAGGTVGPPLLAARRRDAGARSTGARLGKPRRHEPSAVARRRVRILGPSRLRPQRSERRVGDTEAERRCRLLQRGRRLRGQGIKPGDARQEHRHDTAGRIGCRPRQLRFHARSCLLGLRQLRYGSGTLRVGTRELGVGPRPHGQRWLRLVARSLRPLSRRAARRPRRPTPAPPPACPLRGAGAAAAQPAGRPAQ